LHQQGSGNGNAKKVRKDDVFQNLFSQCKSVRSVKNIFSLLSTHIAFLLRFVFVKFFYFFKVLNFYIRCSTCLVLPFYVVKCRNLVSTSLSILKGVKPVVFLLRNKLFKKLNFFLYVVVSPPLHYLYVCFLDVGRRANSKITSFKFYQKSFGSCGERFLRVACRMVSSFVCVAFSFFCSYFFFSSY